MIEYLQYTFFRNAVLGILIISIVSGIIGTYIVTRRLVSLSGGITHSCFGGLGLGYFIGFNPMITAMIFAVLSSVGIEWMSTRNRIREDSAIAMVWALGMAIGILFIFLTPGYAPELNSFLFGNILTITAGDLWAFTIYCVILVAFFLIFRRQIITCAFDPDFAKVSGLPVKFINYSMTILVAVCIVLTIRLVGIMLLIAMLTIPVLIAEMKSNNFSRIVLLAITVSVVSSLSGLWLATIIDVPCSSIIVILQVILFVIAQSAKRILTHREMQ